MSTLKPCVKNDFVKSDGKNNIKIRISHDRKVRYLKTPCYIEPNLLGKDGRIKQRHPNYIELSLRDVADKILAGHIKNGTLDGKWTFTNSSYGTIDGEEYFEEGSFIKGESKGLTGDATYKDHPRATFFEYIPQEGVNVYQYSLGCLAHTYNPPVYKNRITLNGEFYPELLDKIAKQVSVIDIENQWFMVAFNINGQKQLNNLKIKSSVGNIELLQKLGEIITSMNGWTDAGVVNGKTINYPFYFVIAFENGNMIIPEYQLPLM